jgi:hypothetical protein
MGPKDMQSHIYTAVAVSIGDNDTGGSTSGQGRARAE